MEILNKDLSLLMSINDDIATIKDTKTLFITIFRKFYAYYNLPIGGFALFDKYKEKIGLIFGKTELIEEFHEPVLWFQTISSSSFPFGISALDSKIIYADAVKFYSSFGIGKNQITLKEALSSFDIKSFLLVPMKTSGDLVGYLLLPTIERNLSEEETEYLSKIANLIASALSNAQAYGELKQKEEQKEMQLSLLVSLVNEKERDSLQNKLTEQINKLIPCDYITLHAHTQETTSTHKNISATFCYLKDENQLFKNLSVNRSVLLSIQTLAEKKEYIKKDGYYELVGTELENLCMQTPHFRYLKEKHSITSILLLQYGYENLGELSLILGRKEPFPWFKHKYDTGTIFLQNVDSYFLSNEIDLGLQLLPQIGLVLANVYAFEEIQVLTKKLEQEKNYLLDEINLTNNFQEIIGNSAAIQSTLNKVQQVAPLDVTVLIQGETGTGKELIARAIHNLSNRKENAFITVNCAALPAQLIESELFGHEKGSFTGAIEKRIGKFEVANKGTIFLDEIGELPLEIQSKLLRVLQEKEFERLGGKSTIFSDVRIIAATNRDLEKEVAQGKFRADLFFRLNVFPIIIPPLRERKDDIPALVKYFIEKYSKRIGKEVKSIRKTDIDKLNQYLWPGNIRELEHLIERAIIISEGSALNFEKLLGGDLFKMETDTQAFRKLIDIEKEHIITALKISNGKITGENSASQLLGINGKTLGSKMRKLGIKREIIIKT